ncbi:hypothetical protein K435DRAFT_853653 [Dendrothele bispora CBS 962.96]|uniref:Uncharacterized protein n=1 Tax=Dendrothele bispora (strain CBS 962.96) TaxID=1314807 RepID=A0A4S8MFT9_DENBC|nr:hypothetical protein K435DRAFT_853653 [Dendrothele bispora CBS 962.96]
MSFGPPPNPTSRKPSNTTLGVAAVAGSQTRVTSHSLSHQNANESPSNKSRSTGPSSNVATPGISLKNVVLGPRGSKSSETMNLESTPSKQGPRNPKDSLNVSTTRNEEVRGGASSHLRSDTGEEESPLSSFDEEEEVLTPTPRKDKGKSVASNSTLKVPIERSVFEEEKSYPHIFSKFHDVIPLFDEPLYSSISRYYAPFNHASDYDILLPFGVLENGSMPGRSAEDSCLLRDAITRWEGRMDVFPFGDRFSTVREFALQFPFSYVDRSQVLELTQPDGKASLYTIGTESLRAIGHMVLALNQILEGLPLFIDSSQRINFVLDPNFLFLKALEIHGDPDVIVVTLKGLQMRTKGATERVDMYLKRIQVTYVPSETNPSEAAASFYSTTPSERLGFESGTAEENMGRLLSRSEYRNAIHDHNGVASRMINLAVEKGYEVRQHHYIPSRFAISSNDFHKNDDPKTIPTPVEDVNTPSLSTFQVSTRE